MVAKGLLLTLLTLTSGSLLALGFFFVWASAGRYPQGRYADIITQSEVPYPTPAETLTVVSYNLGYLSGLTNNQAVSRSPQLYAENLTGAIAALSRVNADVIALQEVDIQAARSFNQDQAAALAIAMAYPQRAIAINWDKRYVPFPFWPPSAHFGAILSGQAVLSRWPITRHDRIVLEKVRSNPFYYNALYLDRLAQVVEVSVGDRPLIIINVHLEAFDGPTRQRQTAFVRQLAEEYAQTLPVLLLGDFNSAVNRPEEGEPVSINQLLESSKFLPAVGPDQWEDIEQTTFPSDSPQYKLDYIFYTPATMDRLEVKVLQTAAQASDHLPIVIKIRWR